MYSYIVKLLALYITVLWKSDLRLRKRLVKFYIWSKALYGTETLTLWKMRCWSRMGKIIWTDRVNNEEVLHKVKKEVCLLRTIKRRKTNSICYTLRSNCLLKHGIERKIVWRIVMMERRGRRRKQLLGDLRKTNLLVLESGGTRSHRGENSLWKRLWVCRKTDY
jgi:hypothetical protein